MIAAALIIICILQVLGYIEKRALRKESKALREEVNYIRQNQAPFMSLAETFILMVTEEVGRMKDEINDIKRHTEKQSD